MKVYNTILTVIAAALLCISCGEKKVNHNYMWFDCEANYATLSHPD